MKRKEFEELRNKPLAELQNLLKESRLRLRNLKFDLLAGKVKKIQEIKELKKDIARIMTFINQKSK